MLRKTIYSLFILLFVYTCSESPIDSDNDFGDIKDPGAIRIGFVNDINSIATLNRLQSLAADTDMLSTLGIKEFKITEIASDIDPDSLKNYTIVYLPVGWKKDKRSVISALSFVTP